MKKSLQKTILSMLLAFFGWSNNTNAQTPVWAWATDSINALGGMITDASGNIYVACDLGNNTVFLRKYDPNRNTIWSSYATGKSKSSLGVDYHNNLAFDPSGNILVTGYFTSDSIILGTTIVHRVSALDMFVAKYTSTGTLIWVNSAAVGGIGNTGYSVAGDAAGDVIVVGSYSSPTLTIGTTTLTNLCTFSGGCPSEFVAKYSGSNGNPIWLKSDFAGVGTSYCYSVITDASNNIYVAGDFQSFSSIRNGIIKYNSAGDTLWTQGDGGWFLTSDLSGNVYTGVGHSNAGVKKIDPVNGSVIWSKTGTGTGTYDAVGIHADAAGNIYYTGQYDADVTFGSTLLVNQGQTDIFIVSYNSGGNCLWAKGTGGVGTDALNASAVDGAGNVYANGYVIGSNNTTVLSFDATDITTTINYGGGIFLNIYFAKLGNNIMGVKSLSANEEFNAYPNPAAAILNIALTQAHSNAEIKITDILGKEIASHILASGEKNASLDVSNLNNGVYFVNLKTTEGVVTKKIVISK
jgi:hypothetical protein